MTIATAGWAIPKAVAYDFPTAGSGLQRYSARFSAVEVNSTFYRSHRASTYARWRDTTPAGFRFAVKLPKQITHEARLLEVADLLAAFTTETSTLGEKLGPLLVQLPPSLPLAFPAHDAFFAALRAQWTGAVACEPRHASWFETEGDALLSAHQIARVAADPALHPRAGSPGGWSGFAYWRLHGSPRRYYSSYNDGRLEKLGRDLKASPAPETFCVFDNTASGAAAADALCMQHLLESPEDAPSRPAD